ncbi:hypothetical protein GMI70_05325 [Eggerthellaceae bacterium zg-893]|nr:hypothetical protein [Eggerthellaceae bacterium zg-893]
METDLTGFDAEQLLMACACMESARVAFINKCERDGYDTTELREILDYVHAAVDGLRDE